MLCQADTLDPGRPLVVTITATLAADVPAGDLSNSATVAAATHDPDLSDNGDTVNAPTAPANLTVTKAVDAPAGHAGRRVQLDGHGHQQRTRHGPEHRRRGHPARRRHAGLDV